MASLRVPHHSLLTPEEPRMDLALEIVDVVDVLPTCHA
jgi:hypothetical protein